MSGPLLLLRRHKDWHRLLAAHSLTRHTGYLSLSMPYNLRSTVMFCISEKKKFTNFWQDLIIPLLKMQEIILLFSYHSVINTYCLTCILQ